MIETLLRLANQRCRLLRSAERLVLLALKCALSWRSQHHTPLAKGRPEKGLFGDPLQKEVAVMVAAWAEGKGGSALMSDFQMNRRC